MGTIKVWISICILFIYPLLPGSFLCYAMKLISGKENRQQAKCSAPAAFLAGGLMYGASFGVLAFASVRTGVTFDAFSMYALFLTVGIFAVCVMFLLIMRGYRVYVTEGVWAFGRSLREPSQWKSYVPVVFSFVLVAAVYSIYPFQLQELFDTPERVITILDTGRLSGWNVFTGEVASAAGNWKQQLCNVPLLYACLCRWFSLPVITLLSDVIPYGVLVLAFCVIAEFARLFSEQKEGCVFALVLFALLTMCGSEAYMNTSYGLLHAAYEPMTMFSSVILPLGFVYAVSRKNIVFLILTWMNGLFLVGVEKAVMILAAQLLCMIVSAVAVSLWKRRGQTWT